MIKQCPKGHLYDDNNGPICPYCNQKKPDPVQPMPPIEPLVIEDGDGFIPTGGIIFPTYKEDDPVAGWLVCLSDGNDYGKSFEIRGEKTTVGRDESCDIRFKDILLPSSSSVFFITFDQQTNTFNIVPEKTWCNIYLNDNLTLKPTELHDRDVLEIGATKLLFKALCDDDFHWREFR